MTINIVAESIFHPSIKSHHFHHATPTNPSELKPPISNGSVSSHEQIDEEGEDGDEPNIQAIRMKSASPRINPFHLLSHPTSSDVLPPLPPHLERLASGDDNHASAIAGRMDEPLPPLPNGEAPVHITKVTRDHVQVAAGPSPEVGRPNKILNKITSAFKREPEGETYEPRDFQAVVMQGPPPSPPLSESDLAIESEDSHAPTEFSSNGHVIELDEPAPSVAGPPLSPLSEVTEAPLTPQIFTSNLVAEPSDMGNSSPITPIPPASHLAVPSGRRVSSSSTASRTGSLAVVRASRLAQQRNTASPSNSVEPELSPTRPVEEDRSEDESAGFSRSRRGSGTSLASNPARPTPITTAAPRMIRRSTNPTPVSAASNPTRSPLLHTQSTLGPGPARSRTAVPGLEGSELDADILAHTEILRRERLERRQKKAEEASPETVTREPKEPKPVAEAKVLVGNLIGEDHVNYVLMYNMLTGIRIGVSRCQAKIKRPLTDEDYVARHKFSFDIIGNELTPSARYDFKFKDYAPWIFRDLRDEHFHLDPADYLLSLTAKYILSELGSPGKSGSFFYFSRDYRFIIKTISHSEHKFLRSILKDYHNHVKTNPHTLLSRFYGLHRVKLPRGRKIHFVIMNNLFPPHKDIHETYDLKGSAYGREYDEEKAKLNPKAVLKDKNWVNRNRTLELGPEKRALLTEQLRRDQEFLKRIKVMDYSLLVGIHNMERGNRDNLRENTLTMFHPEMPQSRRKPSTIKGQSEASNVRKAVRRSDPKLLDAASQLPQIDSSDRKHFLFYQDEGGMRATDEANQNMDVIYYLGVIDICTPYNSVKKIEHLWKSMTEDRQTISCIDPVSYGQRFLNFLMSVMRGGDPSLRPVGLLSHTKSEEPAVGEQSVLPASPTSPTSPNLPTQSPSQRQS